MEKISIIHHPTDIEVKLLNNHSFNDAFVGCSTHIKEKTYKKLMKQ